MRKFLCILIVAILAGCSTEVSKPDKTKNYDLFGRAYRGFFIEPSSEYASMRNWGGPGSESASVDSATRAFELVGEDFWTSLVEVSTSARDYVDPYGSGSRLVEDMTLKAVIDLDNGNNISVNYLTTLATDLIWDYMDQGDSYEDARVKANTAVLNVLHMPKKNTDFEHYAPYGDGEGDAMLAALSIVFEKYYLEYSMSTAWESLDINLATGEFVNSNVLWRLAGYANAIIREDGGDSLRRAIEAKAPKGKVGNFEKYLRIQG